MPIIAGREVRFISCVGNFTLKRKYTTCILASDLDSGDYIYMRHAYSSRGISLRKLQDERWCLERGIKCYRLSGFVNLFFSLYELDRYLENRELIEEIVSNMRTYYSFSLSTQKESI